MRKPLEQFNENLLDIFKKEDEYNKLMKEFFLNGEGVCNRKKDEVALLYASLDEELTTHQPERSDPNFAEWSSLEVIVRFNRARFMGRDRNLAQDAMRLFNTVLLLSPNPFFQEKAEKFIEMLGEFSESYQNNSKARHNPHFNLVFSRKYDQISETQEKEKKNKGTPKKIKKTAEKGEQAKYAAQPAKGATTPPESPPQPSSLHPKKRFKTSSSQDLPTIEIDQDSSTPSTSYTNRPGFTNEPLLHYFQLLNLNQLEQFQAISSIKLKLENLADSTKLEQAINLIQIAEKSQNDILSGEKDVIEKFSKAFLALILIKKTEDFTETQKAQMSKALYEIAQFGFYSLKKKLSQGGFSLTHDDTRNCFIWSFRGIIKTLNAALLLGNSIEITALKAAVLQKLESCEQVLPYAKLIIAKQRLSRGEYDGAREYIEALSDQYLAPNQSTSTLVEICAHLSSSEKNFVVSIVATRGLIELLSAENASPSFLVNLKSSYAENIQALDPENSDLAEFLDMINFLQISKKNNSFMQIYDDIALLLPILQRGGFSRLNEAKAIGEKLWKRPEKYVSTLMKDLDEARQNYETMSKAFIKRESNIFVWLQNASFPILNTIQDLLQNTNLFLFDYSKAAVISLTFKFNSFITLLICDAWSIYLLNQNAQPNVLSDLKKFLLQQLHLFYDNFRSRCGLDFFHTNLARSDCQNLLFLSFLNSSMVAVNSELPLYTLIRMVGEPLNLSNVSELQWLKDRIKSLLIVALPLLSEQQITEARQLLEEKGEKRNWNYLHFTVANQINQFAFANPSQKLVDANLACMTAQSFTLEYGLHFAHELRSVYGDINSADHPLAKFLKILKENYQQALAHNVGLLTSPGIFVFVSAHFLIRKLELDLQKALDSQIPDLMYQDVNLEGKRAHTALASPTVFGFIPGGTTRPSLPKRTKPEDSLTNQEMAFEKK